MTEGEIRDLFREMREEPVPADSLARVRLKLGDRVRRRARWKLAAWVTAGAAVVLALLAMPPGAVVRHPAVAPRAVRVAKIPAPAAAVTVRPAIRRTPRRRMVQKSEPVTIRIQTPDPDVVIILVGQ